ncbi:MAG: hypothetical protein PVF29_06875, partial [Desulfobacterales bacterium]
RRDGEPQPHLSHTDTSARNMLVYRLTNNPDTKGIRVMVRPSGTEPKIKMYFEVFGKPFKLTDIESEMEKVIKTRESLEKNFMQYCYKLLDVDFPDRGFLLFWQLPLTDKLKYFEIEEDITGLKRISDKNERKEKLFELLEFLGANPIQKIDKAFEAKYQSGILKYLKLS